MKINKQGQQETRENADKKTSKRQENASEKPSKKMLA